MNMEKGPKIEGNRSIFDRREVQDLIKSRHVKPEDFHLLEKLAGFPKDLIISELHNLFNMNHEKSGKELESMIEQARDDEQKDLFETMLRFYKNYDWTASYNLVRVLEKL